MVRVGLPDRPLLDLVKVQRTCVDPLGPQAGDNPLQIFWDVILERLLHAPLYERAGRFLTDLAKSFFPTNVQARPSGAQAFRVEDRYPAHPSSSLTPRKRTVLIIELAALWTVIIPAMIVLGLLVAHRVMAPRAEQRRRAVREIWTGAFPCEESDARALTRRPGRRLPAAPQRGALSRR